MPIPIARPSRASSLVILAAGAVATALLFAPPLDATGLARTSYADEVALGDGTARTYVTLDARGELASLGVELSERALEGLPASPVMLHLPLPSELARTQYRFVMLDWNPQGHEPAHVYTVPHFDFHFYMTTADTIARIAGGPDPVVPEPRFVPDGYVSPGNAAVPGMGVHWVDREAGELAGRPFDQTLLYGFTGGRMIFVEPMITRAFLLGKPDFAAPVKQPAEVQRSGAYPARYGIRWDASRRVYRVSLDSLRMR